ncbi:hypothetical protein DCAR_0624567 [Daucus carota subsp. sativus]|uniref:Pentacotripeptide-repeat region of PRORP domain-containing protein n=1 Tax=Daucus carota subsp. sativus TaxID=79200 RepID=A0AAF1B599_DAUCS|nr:PREDICTED: pentatricopeptide repeat-containing protein At5g39350-like [Daucus carota subsp. sativus]WOH05153.1 hypothetical protein DCAR_0624567 [Daucus carota subsp. sativus]
MNGKAFEAVHKLKLLLLTTATNTAQCRSLLLHFAAVKSLTNTKQLHSKIIASGLLTSKDSFYISSLLTSTYASCGHVSYARHLFDKLPYPTSRLFSAMIRMYAKCGLAYDALQLFVEMLVSGYVLPDKLTYPFVIKACGDSSWIRLGVVLHGLAVVNGFDCDVFVGNSLLAMYMNCGKKERARRLFDKMGERRVVSWNTMISGYVQNGSAKEALLVFKEMVNGGVEVDLVTIISVLPACGYLKDYEAAKLVHLLADEKALGDKLHVRNALVDVYVKCGRVDEARKFFDDMNVRDVVTWTTMINGVILNGDFESALSLFPMMLLEGVKPNAFTLACLLSACVGSQHLKCGKGFHGWATRHKLESDVNVETALIDMYAKCNCVHLSFRVFGKTSKKRQVPWNAIISGCVRNGLEREAVVLFNEMLSKGIGPNEATLKCVLPAYSTLANLQQAKNIHSYLIKSRFLTRVEVATGLIDIYSKCGNLDDAYMIFDGIPLSDKDIFLWSVVIAGYGAHGHGKTALTLFNQMVQSGVAPNEVTFTSALHACSHAGLVDEGLCLFQFMLQIQHSIPKADHYTCIVDLLGRAGRLEEAHELIRTMPFQAEHAVWGALLGACVIHENVELGEIAANRLFKLEPGNTGNYVLLGKIYSAAGRWKDAENIRYNMNDIGLIKSPSNSLVEVRNM